MDWNEALEQVARAFRDTRATYGPNAVGVFGGGSLTNEKSYLLGKFARVALQTPNIDYNGRFCMSSAAASIRAPGLDRGLPFPLADIAGMTSISAMPVRTKYLMNWAAPRPAGRPTTPALPTPR